MNSLDLKSRNYLITGGAGFLGLEHAKGIIQNNGNPILLDISNESLIAAKESLKKQFSLDIKTCVCDITKEEEVLKVYQEIAESNIDIHGLINNAAVNPVVRDSISKNELTRLEFFPLEKWEKEINVGLTGSFLCSKYFSKLMLKNEVQGVIINISSDLGMIAPDQRLYEIEGLDVQHQPVKPITYSVVKTGLVGLSRYLATYYEGKIRSNAICPGGVENNQNISFVRKLEKLIPYGRMAKKDELSGLLVFLLSDASIYINGAVIPIDGGRTAW